MKLPRTQIPVMPAPETEPGQNPWVPIPYSETALRLERDTEFMCSDGIIRQVRIDGEVGYAETSTFHTFDYKDPYRYTHRRDWKPQLEWAPYFGMKPSTHYGYRCETRVSDGQNEYRFVPTNQYIKHEPDGWIEITANNLDEISDVLARAGLTLSGQSEGEPS